MEERSVLGKGREKKWRFSPLFFILAAKKELRENIVSLGSLKVPQKTG